MSVRVFVVYILLIYSIIKRNVSDFAPSLHQFTAEIGRPNQLRCPDAFGYPEPKFRWIKALEKQNEDGSQGSGRLVSMKTNLKANLYPICYKMVINIIQFTPYSPAVPGYRERAPRAG